MVIFNNKLYKLNCLLSSLPFSSSSSSTSLPKSISSSFNTTKLLLLAASKSGYDKLALIELLWLLSNNHFCEEAGSETDYKMPSLPQAAFAACKIRSYIDEEDATGTKSISKIQQQQKQNSDDCNNKQETSKNFSNEKFMEYTPVKYNSKLMNSIWGFYNRYSPHNIKGNDDENLLLKQKTMQQSLTVASYVIAQNIAITFQQSFGDEWNFQNYLKKNQKKI